MTSIIFIPGLLSDGRVWAAQLEALRDRTEVRVANLFDLDSLEEIASAALRLTDGPVVLVGHSMGGPVAVEMIRQAPDRVAGLVLADTAMGPVRDGESANRLDLVALAHTRGMAALADRWLPPMVHPDRAADLDWLEPLKVMVGSVTPEQHERQIRAMLARPDSRQVLPSIRCPTLILVGREDRWSPIEQHQDLARAIADAELHIFDHCGHFAPVEQPELTTRRLLAWLETRGFLLAGSVGEGPGGLG